MSEKPKPREGAPVRRDGGGGVPLKIPAKDPNPRKDGDALGRVDRRG